MYNEKKYDFRHRFSLKFIHMKKSLGVPMNYLWAGMLLLGIVYGGFRGEMAAITEAALSSAKEAVSLCITLLGSYR